MRLKTFLLLSGCIALRGAAMGGAAQGATGIGMATGEASYYVNGSAVSGSATLFEKTTVKAGVEPVRLQLAAGEVFYLSPNSEAEVRERAIRMESGHGDYQTSGKSRVTARGLTVRQGSEAGLGRVAVMGKNQVQVASAKGLFRVYNAAGILVANVASGLALEFEPQGGAPTSAIGCVLKKDGKFVLYDQTTRVTMELRGKGFEQEWGNRVQANGIAQAAGLPGQGTTQILDVTSITRIDAGGCQDAASAIGGELPQGATAGARTTPPPAPTGGGMSAGAKIGTAVGVVGGAVGGIVVATRKGRS